MFITLSNGIHIMEYPFYQVDAFSDNTFGGNPAAVMILSEWLPAPDMQAIAGEMNLSETVFCVPSRKHGIDFDIRWFSPTAEVDLCGHATVAAAHVLFRHEGFVGHCVNFSSMSGKLGCSQDEQGRLALDFPACPLTPTAISPLLTQALGIPPEAVFSSNTRVQAVFATSEQVMQLQPDVTLLKQLPQYGICCTAPASGKHRDVDFVCRFFAPAIGIDEDPVTGSAYTSLVPYYAQTLGKKTLTARQLSARGGELALTLAGDRVYIAGNAVTVIKGQFYL